MQAHQLYNSFDATLSVLNKGPRCRNMWKLFFFVSNGAPQRKGTAISNAAVSTWIYINLNKYFISVMEVCVRRAPGKNTIYNCSAPYLHMVGINCIFVAMSLEQSLLFRFLSVVIEQMFLICMNWTSPRTLWCDMTIIFSYTSITSSRL